MTPSAYRRARIVVPVGTPAIPCGSASGGVTAAPGRATSRSGASWRRKSTELVLTYRPKRPCHESCMGCPWWDYTTELRRGSRLPAPGRPHLHDGGLRDVLEEVLRGRGLVEEAADQGLGAAQGLQHEDLLQRPFLE